MNASVSFLSAAIWIPILTGAFLLAYGRARNPAVSRAVALVGSLAGLLATLPPREFAAGEVEFGIRHARVPGQIGGHAAVQC